MLTILADENIPLVHALFNQLGTVTTMPGRDIESRHLVGIDILLVRSVTKVNRNLLQGSTVKFVGSCTIGKDHLDINYMEQMEIGWANAPGCNANAVVQYVFSAMATLVPDWHQRVVGIIGCGNVGGRLLHCLRSMGIKCVCYDPLINQNGPELATLTDVLTADIISVHTPLTTTSSFPTYHMLGEHELAQLKAGTLLINTSRGEVIDNTALLWLLQQHQKNINVVLDVWEGEPDINVELLGCVDIGTAHIAGHSIEGKQQGSVQVYRALYDYLKGAAGATSNRSAYFVDTTFSDTPADRESGFESERPKKRLTLNKEINEESDIHAQRNAVLLAAYNINDDDQKLRQCYSQQQQPMSVFFDELRKNYPVRRDYSHCVLPDWLEKHPHQNFLSTLGFC